MGQLTLYNGTGTVTIAIPTHILHVSHCHVTMTATWGKYSPNLPSLLIKVLYITYCAAAMPAY